MHSAPCTKTSISMSGHSWRIFSISSSDSSRDRMMRETPAFCQNFTVAQLVVLACTERWTSVSGHFSLTIMIRPGSAMISASGLHSITGSMSRI